MDKKWIKEIQDKTKKIHIASGRSNKWGRIDFEDLVFLPAQLAKKPVDYYREEISSRTVI